MGTRPPDRRLDVRQANGANGSKASGASLPDAPWAAAGTQVANKLSADPEQGLSSSEARQRLAQYGGNQLQAIRPQKAWKILLAQFRSLVIGLLCLAAAVALWFGDYAEGLAVLAVIAFNTGIGFVTELRATRSMEALRQLGHFQTRVRRDGQLSEIPAEMIVPGDIVILEGGDIITADLRILQASALQADESTLTGESNPVDKTSEPLPPDSSLMERSNMLFKGTSITRGSGFGIVTGTGQSTELGQIAQLVRNAEAQETPLEKRLDALGRRLVWVMIGIAVMIAAAGVAAGRDVVLAIQVAVALMVAAIPEGLPIVATIALARGMWRMARRNALIVRLSAVETLGATGIILTDKTGTLTENRMTVQALLLPGHLLQFEREAGATGARLLEDGKAIAMPVEELARRLLRSAALCNNAALSFRDGEETEAVGDPTEIALLLAAEAFGVELAALAAEYPRLKEEPFSADSKRMAVFNRTGEEILISVKGAPEALVPSCTSLLTEDGIVPMEPGRADAFLREVQELGESGLRMLALAFRMASQPETDARQDLVLLGAAGLMDPARMGVREAIERCRAAGIRVVMVTGDHVATARHIARDVHLIEPEAAASTSIDALEQGPVDAATLARAQVIARVSPRQKFDLIRHFQQNGFIVAMTGDGVNDAPALKQADIGVAMGIRGTAVAREAAAMVLQDDQFPTIVEAIAQGRAIYANIRKFVVYLLSCNISEVLVVGLATLAGAPLPLLPLQILFLNLVTDVFPALALGVGEGHAGLMDHPPRRSDEGILCGRHWMRVAIYGAVMSFCVLAAMGLARLVLGLTGTQAVTVSFCTLALSQLWHVFNMRDASSHWRQNEITRNAWIWGAIGLCMALILVAVYAPGIGELLELQHPTWRGWALIFGMSLVPLLLAPWVFRMTPEPPPSRPGLDEKTGS